MRVVAQLAVVIGLVVLAALNISVKGWTEMEDGVLWVGNGSDVVASVVAADSPASRAGIKPGDLLLRIDTKVRTAPGRRSRVAPRIHRRIPSRVRRSSRQAESELLIVPVAGIPSGTHWLYLALASVGLFSLFVGTGVRLRRPENQATLHFFWLCVAFFGVLTFSFSGRLDLLDWVFYWGDVVAMLLLPPLFVHFALVFPERPDAGRGAIAARSLLPLVYLPALLLGAAKVGTILRGDRRGDILTSVVNLVDSAELVYLAICLVGGFVIMTRALYRVRSVTARRQLRWIVWGTGLGALPVRVRVRAPIRARVHARGRVRADRGAPGAGAARVRVGDHPLPVDGRRGHHQARPRLCGRDCRHRRDLHDCPRDRRQLVHAPGPTTRTRSSRFWRRWCWCCWRVRSRTRFRPASTASTTATATTTAARSSASRATSTAISICSA